MLLIADSVLIVVAANVSPVVRLVTEPQAKTVLHAIHLIIGETGATGPAHPRELFRTILGSTGEYHHTRSECGD